MLDSKSLRLPDFRAHERYVAERNWMIGLIIRSVKKYDGPLLRLADGRALNSKKGAWGAVWGGLLPKQRAVGSSPIARSREAGIRE